MGSQQVETCSVSFLIGKTAIKTVQNTTIHLGGLDAKNDELDC